MDFPYDSVMTLPEFSFIGGSDWIFNFYVYDSASQVVDVTSSTCTWTLGKFGWSDAVVTKSGSPSGSPLNQIIVSVDENDTSGLYGVFIHQLTVEDALGHVYKPSQGLLNISSNIS